MKEHADRMINEKAHFKKAVDAGDYVDRLMDTKL